jgi:hypothetical protein
VLLKENVGCAECAGDPDRAVGSDAEQQPVLRTGFDSCPLPAEALRELSCAECAVQGVVEVLREAQEGVVALREAVEHRQRSAPDNPTHDLPVHGSAPKWEI